MPATLFKLVISATATTDVTTKPDVQRFFYNFDPAHLSGNTLTIPADAFVDDAGDAVTSLTTMATDNGYYLLFINGVLQQETLYTVSDTQVVVNDASTLEDGVPIVLVVTNFAPEADSQITVNT
jgi:hypothetical protein